MSGRSRAMRAVRYSAWSPRIFKVMLLPCPPPRLSPPCFVSAFAAIARVLTIATLS
jgi:hypothetical protein